MKQGLKIFILLLLFSPVFTKGQEAGFSFSADTTKFPDDLKAYFRTIGSVNQDEAREVLSSFMYLWTSNLLQIRQKEQVMSVCNAMLEKKLKAFPYFTGYLDAVSMLVRQNFPDQALNTYHHSVLFCLDGQSPARNLGNYLEQMTLLLRHSAFLKNRTEAWYARYAEYNISFDSVPVIIFPSLDLACVSRTDSACVYGTSGKFYPLKSTWYGYGGKVYWDRAGLPRDQVYAELHNYIINVKSTGYTADSVAFVHKGYFNQPVNGNLEERIIADVSPETAVYPKFRMFDNTRVILSLFRDITYEGGFGFEGSRVIGFSNKTGNAIIEIKHEDRDPLIILRSSEFLIRTDRFVSARASLTFFLEDDSIFHTGAQVRYVHPNRELVVSRSEEGLSQSPFMNTYHNLDMYSEALYFKLDGNEISLEALRGIRSKGEAIFESRDYFSGYRFDKMQGMDDQHPAYAVAGYVRKRGYNIFYTDELAQYLKKPLEQVRVSLIKLANAGFLVYDAVNDKITVTPRLMEFLAAKSGAKDYDNIQFNSFVKTGSNAILDLKSMNLKIYGVESVMLSDTQFVYVVPANREVTVLKNRDFTFRGRVHAGFFDFFAHECTFDYSKFRVNIPVVDSMAIYVPAWIADANGYRPVVKVRNVVANMSGELQIDSPSNKSGRNSSRVYPFFTSKDNSFVYFDSPGIEKGVYNRKNFYYTVYPFVLDSMNWLAADKVVFEGKLVSAIFPDITEPLRVQKDYSLGFRKVLSQPGLPVYAGKGRYSDTLMLSNQGLRGSGTLNYLTSSTVSSDFAFYPDSSVAVTRQFNLAPAAGAVEYPEVNIKKARVKWFPGGDMMQVANASDGKFSMFNKQAELNGSLLVTPSGLRGKGEFDFEDAVVKSDSYHFNNHAFSSDTADFTLYTPDRKSEVLKVHIFRTSIDFRTRRGHFIASGKGANMEFLVNKYQSVVDEFDWLMDQQTLQLNNNVVVTREEYANKTLDQLIAFDPKANRYVSTDPGQNRLNFFATTSLYNIPDNILQVEDARIIKVADAAIFPKNGKVRIDKDGKMQELKEALIIADTAKRYYNFYNATVNITSRLKYNARGLMDYIPGDGEMQTVEVKAIGTDNNAKTFAKATVTDSANFMINRYFQFKGDIDMQAPNPSPLFTGSFRMQHDCYQAFREWIKVRAEINPKKVRIPVRENIENEGDGKLRVSVFYSGTDNAVKPGFFVKPDNVSDLDILSATGFVTYDSLASAYKVTTAEKLDNPGKAGNLLQLNTVRCSLEGEGRITLTGDLGRLEMMHAGNMSYYMIPDSLVLHVMTILDFFFPEEALKVMATDINSRDLNGIDVGSPAYTKSLREFAGDDETNRMLQELSLYGLFRKFPPALDHTMVLTDIHFTFNRDQRSYFNTDGRIGISNLGKTLVNKYVKGYFEILKRRTGDSFTLYLEAGENQWYFFTYSNGTMQALSSNKDFNELLTGLKESDRVIKGGKGIRNYQFIISAPDKKITFMRKIRQMTGE